MKSDHRQRVVGKLGVVWLLLSFCYLLSLDSVSLTCSPIRDEERKGLMVVTSFGTLQEYYLENQLSDHTKSDVAYVPHILGRSMLIIPKMDLFSVLICRIRRLTLCRTIFRFSRSSSTHHHRNYHLHFRLGRHCILQGILSIHACSFTIWVVWIIPLFTSYSC